MTIPPPRTILSAVAVSVAEWLFAIFPLVVVSIVTANMGRLHLLFESQEWAFGAAILSAQALFRFVGGVTRAPGIALKRVLLGVALMLVGIVGPANVILALVVTSELRDHTVSSGLSAAQAIFFCLSSIVFILLAAISDLWTSKGSSSAHAG